MILNSLMIILYICLFVYTMEEAIYSQLSIAKKTVKLAIYSQLSIAKKR